MPKFLTFKVSVDSLGADGVDFSVEIYTCVVGFLNSGQACLLFIMQTLIH